MEFDFNRYIEVFNQNDEDLLGDLFFTEDIVCDGPDRTFYGREEWLGMLKFAHVNMRERLVPLLVVREGDKIMAVVNVVFTAIADRPDFHFGPMKSGDSLTMRFFASYHLRGNKIAHMSLAWWPPGLRSV